MSTEPSAARIVLADPVASARASLRRLIETGWGWSVVGEASDGLEAIRETRDKRPDVLLVDSTISNLGLGDIREMLSSEPGLVIIGLLGHPGGHAEDPGPSVLKSVPTDTLRDFIDRELTEVSGRYRRQRGANR